MENKNNSTETIIFKTPIGKVKLNRFDEKIIEVNAQTKKEKYHFPLDFDTEKERDGVFQIWSLKRAKDLLKYLNDREE